MNWSPTALAYMASHAIDPCLAWECGVRERPGMLVYPTPAEDAAYWPRRRSLDRSKPKVKPLWSGRSPAPWWIPYRPESVGDWDVLVCEGESDALAAASTLRAEDRVHVVEGKACKIETLVAELVEVGASVVALACDGDAGGTIRGDRTSGMLVAAGIGARVLSMPWGHDLANVLAGIDTPDGRWPDNQRQWLLNAMVNAEPVGLEVAALRRENAWLWAREGERMGASGGLSGVH